MFELPVKTLKADGVGKVTMRGLTFSARLALQEQVEGNKGMFPANLLAAVVESPKLSAQEWDVFGGTNQDSFLALFEKATKLAGLSAEDAEKKADGTDSP